MDHFRSLVYLLSPSDSNLQKILEQRLYLAKAKSTPSYSGTIDSLFFKGPTVRLPDTHEDRYWSDFIIKSSRERPRDIVQLLYALSTRAIAEPSKAIGEPNNLINSETVGAALFDYSKERVDDLKLEYEKDCPQLKEIISAFIDINWESPAEDMKAFLLQMPSRFSISVRTQVLKPEQTGDMFLLWSFLFETGFLNPKIADARQTRGFRHIMYREKPNLVSRTQWGEMQKMIWEIHPAYRSFLYRQREDENARLRAAGIKPKNFHHKN